jgi:hypothetical protein
MADAGGFRLTAMGLGQQIGLFTLTVPSMEALTGCQLTPCRYRCNAQIVAVDGECGMAIGGSCAPHSCTINPCPCGSG